MGQNGYPAMLTPNTTVSKDKHDFSNHASVSNLNNGSLII
jgi:hypothetical protein